MVRGLLFTECEIGDPRNERKEIQVTESNRTSPEPLEDAGKIKILIVDDMRTTRIHTRSMLSAEAYDVFEATNGVEALAVAEKERPHLVLMDVAMPEMDGITCCKKFKENQSLRNIKVIMVTAKGEYRDIAEAFRAGCDDYITKPVNRVELESKVAELGKLARSREQLHLYAATNH